MWIRAVNWVNVKRKALVCCPVFIACAIMVPNAAAPFLGTSRNSCWRVRADACRWSYYCYCCYCFLVCFCEETSRTFRQRNTSDQEVLLTAAWQKDLFLSSRAKCWGAHSSERLLVGSFSSCLFVLLTFSSLHFSPSALLLRSVIFFFGRNLQLNDVLCCTTVLLFLFLLINTMIQCRKRKKKKEIKK